MLMANIDHLLKIMRQLRDPERGCPWDIEQDFQSIAPHTIEEAYEVADAIEREDWSELKSELGDLLLQTVYHSQIATERDLFDFDDVVVAICHKMVDRHPHVFADQERPTSAAQTELWEQQKERERAGAKRDTSILQNIPANLPALTRAVKLQKRAARLGFDWPKINEIIDKVAEEAEELLQELNQVDHAGATEEFGDLLFSLVNFARRAGIDPESALRSANSKFTRRFIAMEEQLRRDGKPFESCDLTILNHYWELAKSREN